jgi:tetratricopeptide (TPR) repeat protein
LLDFGETDSALAEIREALRINPNEANFLDSLGWAHFARGELKKALVNLREANRLQKEPPDEIKAHLRQAERLDALEGRLDSILRGKDVPTEAGGRLDVADLCRLTNRFTTAARFYSEAFQAQPALADDMAGQHRFHAAVAAAQASMMPNRDKEGPLLDAAERSRLRAQALDWLIAEREACAKLFHHNSPQRTLARKTLDILKHHRDLAPLRDGAALKKLPEDEQKKWQDLWSDVDQLINRADRP